MTSIYLIRHTQAEGNLYRMMQGHWDGKVTSNGRLQIDALAERFKNIHLDAVYSSDLSRAIATAGGVTRYNGLPIIQDDRIREINMGPWETQFFGNVSYADENSVRTFMIDSDNWYVEGAETFAMVKERAYAALEDICRHHDNQTIAIVSHGVTIRCLLSKIKNVPLSDFENCPITKNTSVSLLKYDNGKFECEYFNDISHLGDEFKYHWWKVEDLRDEPVNVEDEKDYYESCYRDAWSFAHDGDLTGFNPDVYYRAAKDHQLFKLFSAEKPVGIVELSKFDSDGGYCWINLLYLCEEYRNRGYGVQALGRAIKFCIDNNLHSIRLNCSCDNERALKFYKKYEFNEIGTDEGAQGILYLLERRL